MKIWTRYEHASHQRSKQLGTKPLFNQYQVPDTSPGIIASYTGLFTPRSYHPPIVLLVARLHDCATRIEDVFLQLALAVEMVVTIEGG